MSKIGMKAAIGGLDASEPRIESRDFWRLTQKAVAYAVGKAEVSELTLSAAYEKVNAYEHQVRNDRARGGSADKEMAALGEMLTQVRQEQADLTASQVWTKLEVYGSATPWEHPSGRWQVFRDGNKLLQVDDKTGGVKAIEFEAFRKYWYDTKT